MADLALVLGPEASAAVEVVDISDDDDLERRYGAQVPVLMADGDFVCAYYLDRDRIATYISR